MLKKVESGYENKRLIINNKEFLKLQKIIVQHKIDNCPIVGLDSIHKIGIFDELKFANDMNKIKFICLSSEQEHNYMMVSIDGVIYKYDLSTKEMLFSFKTVSFTF